MTASDLDYFRAVGFAYAGLFSVVAIASLWALVGAVRDALRIRRDNHKEER